MFGHGGPCDARPPDRVRTRPLRGKRFSNDRAPRCQRRQVRGREPVPDRKGRCFGFRTSSSCAQGYSAICYLCVEFISWLFLSLLESRTTFIHSFIHYEPRLAGPVSAQRQVARREGHRRPEGAGEAVPEEAGGGCKGHAGPAGCVHRKFAKKFANFCVLPV